MKDLYSEVTNRIITALEHGTPPWVCPWRDGSALPSNLSTGKPYRGINVLILAIEARIRAYTDHRWLTFRQANEIGARIRQGEHGTPIVFYRFHEIDDDSVPAVEGEPATTRSIPLLRGYTVFNAGQLDALPERFVLPMSGEWEPVTQAEQLLSRSGAQIRHGGSWASYQPSQDLIRLPPTDWFDTAEGYYATALHELCHWTAHPSRLNRVLGGRQEIEAYAFEELIAEIGAAFLCAHCGLLAQLEHASYVDQWLDALRRDKRLIFAAAGAAQKAADFVLSLATLEESGS